MSFQITPNPRNNGSGFAISQNSRARGNSIISIDFDHVTNKLGAFVGGNAISVSESLGPITIDVDYSDVTEITSFDPASRLVLVYSVADGYALVSLASLLTNSNIVRIVTEAGDITVADETQLLIMNRTADESPSNINLPASASKIGKIKVVDWKGNAGTYPHTVNPNGSEKFQGNLSAWTIGADGASAVFDPIPSGLGYAV